MRGNYGMLWNIAMGETEHKWNGMASISIILFFILQTRFVVCLALLTATRGNSNIPKINFKFKDKNLHIYERSITFNVALTTVPNALV